MISPDNAHGLKGMAAAMADHMPVSRGLLDVLLDDISRGGPVSELIGDHPDATTPLFGLRVLAGVKLLVLTGQAPELGSNLENFMSGQTDTHYVERMQHIFRETVLAHPKEIREALDRPVQQHLPNRAGFLLRGLGMLGAKKIRLLELGACAGLTLIPDRYLWFGWDWQWGDEKSSVRISADGPRPGHFDIVERAGCDVSPRDPCIERDKQILRSFIPPEREIDQLELDEALILAAQSPVRVDKATASEWLRKELPRKTEHGTYTVVWHSFFQGYLNSEQRAELTAIMTAAAQHMPLAQISYEPDEWGSAPHLQVTIHS
ncbi:DUF2332 domain-containing protein [Streptomyces sp. NPDC090106]|uniref:DUF2332 domain-containing protein n=1 Tax=Streptomyces sp. NPDC090106 TaxID=3365946 RepID=UPI00380025E0